MPELRCNLLAARVGGNAPASHASGTCPAVLHLVLETSNSVTGETASRAFRREFKFSSASEPSGEITPIPVTSTRRLAFRVSRSAFGVWRSVGFFIRSDRLSFTRRPLFNGRSLLSRRRQVHNNLRAFGASIQTTPERTYYIHIRQVSHSAIAVHNVADGAPSPPPGVSTQRPIASRNPEPGTRDPEPFPLDDPGMWLRLFLNVSASAGV